MDFGVDDRCARAAAWRINIAASPFLHALAVSTRAVAVALAVGAAFCGAPRLHAQAENDPPANFYQSVGALRGDQLKSALHALIDGHTVLPYTASTTDVWDALDTLDEDPARPANVILVYSGDSVAKTSRVQGSSGTWNREHLWPLSLGPGDTGTRAGTDLFHLLPADATTNANRGNLPFDASTAPATPDPEAPLSTRDADSWEPRDADKGRIARAILYMDVRYEPGDDAPDVPDLLLAETSSAPLSRMGRLSTLLDWNRRFPATDAERHRNQRIYVEFQRNRNPFIDNPTYADRVYLNVSAFEAWRLATFTEAQRSNVAVSGEASDVDADGLSVLAEYALALSPTRSDAAGAINAVVTQTDGKTALEVTHRLARFASDGVVVGYETSADLVTWTPVTSPDVSVTRVDALTDLHVARFVMPTNQIFVRLRFSVRP